MMYQLASDMEVQPQNPALKGLDPYDPNLTVEQKLAILEECKINPDYYFGVVCKAETQVSYSYLNTHYSVSRIYSRDNLSNPRYTVPKGMAFSGGHPPGDGCDGSNSPDRS
jgi:hypothetical protein